MRDRHLQLWFWGVKVEQKIFQLITVQGDTRKLREPSEKKVAKFSAWSFIDKETHCD